LSHSAITCEHKYQCIILHLNDLKSAATTTGIYTTIFQVEPLVLHKFSSKSLKQIVKH